MAGDLAKQCQIGLTFCEPALQPALVLASCRGFVHFFEKVLYNRRKDVELKLDIQKSTDLSSFFNDNNNNEADKWTIDNLPGI